VNEINYTSRRTVKRFGSTTRLMAIFCATALGFQANAAETTLTFNGGGSNSGAGAAGYNAQAGTITVNITGDVVTLVDTATGQATTALNPPSRDSFPSALSGSFTIGFEALGTNTTNFDPVDFTGAVATGVYPTATTWGVNSDINPNVNTFPGQGIVFTFDFSNLTGAEGGVNLTKIRMTNDSNGSRVSFLANGGTVSTAVYDSATAFSGADVTQVANQALATGDKIAFYGPGGGQKRLRGLTFDFLAGGGSITAPTLTASVSTTEIVDLDWDDAAVAGGATSYEVYRSTTSGSYGAPIATLTGGTFVSEYSDTGLTNGTTYYYQVVATDGVSPATSNEVQARPVLQGSSIYAHYDASNIANVTVANINEVTAWADISGKGFNADVGGGTPGTVLYPDATQSTLGLDLLDLGETRNMLKTLSPDEQNALLDFNGLAAVNSGFSFFVVARVDALLDGSIRDVVLANTGGTTALALKFQGGSPELILGGVTAEDTIAAVAGDTLVLAANYDASTGTLEFWNSKAGASVSVTVPAGDFSTTAAIFIGGSPNGDQYMDGAIGEVKFYQGKMTAAEFTAEQNLLVDKWLTPAPIQGSTLYAHYDASQGENVTAVTNNEVTALADNSGNAFNATADGTGSAIQYPSASASSYGVTGLDVPATADSKLLTFTSAQQDEWLDFSRGGAAQAYSGFTIFAVVKPDAVGVTTDVVFSNHGNAGTTESLSLRYTAGKPTIWLGGNEYKRSTVVAAGETVVLAVKYDSDTGGLRFWDSESGTTGTATVATTNDFSSVQNMYIAGSLNNSQGMDGLFGELKVYRGAMTDQEFEDERNALMAKWVQNAPVVTAGADASDITLAWVDSNPTASDTYSVYRSEVSGTYGSALASGLTSINYTDSTVIFGTTYYYVVKATRDGIESGFSAEVFEATTAASALYAHYDASDAANVTLENTNEVTAWSDISGNGTPYNAGVGSDTAVLYPDATQSATGLDLLDMGETNSRLKTLLPAQQDALLNFAPDTGEAASNSGFSFFAVARVDALLDGIIRDVVLGNAGNEDVGLVLKFQGGSPKLYVGGVEAEGPSAVPEAGDTLVIAANYNNVTQQLEFWNSKANASVTVNVAAADFSTAAAIFIGGSNNPDQYMDGAIGEVKFYQGRMSPAAFAAEQLALTEKWITGSPVTEFTSWVDGTFINGTLTDKTATGDDDNDGISNLIEFAVAGQDPTVSSSTVGTYSGLVVTFLKRQEDPAVGGITYAIEQSTDLGVTDTWEAVTPTVDDVNSISYTLPGGEAKDFVRLRVTQD
jgi:hypothetical protein